MPNYVVAFNSTHVAMQADAAFRGLERQHSIIPTPRRISANCGMALRFEAKCNDEACRLFYEAGIDPTDSHLYCEVASDQDGEGMRYILIRGESS